MHLASQIHGTQLFIIYTNLRVQGFHVTEAEEQDIY